MRPSKQAFSSHKRPEQIKVEDYSKKNKQKPHGGKILNFTSCTLSTTSLQETIKHIRKKQRVSGETTVTVLDGGSHSTERVLL